MNCATSKCEPVVLDWMHDEMLADTTGQCPQCFKLLNISDLSPAYTECLDYNPDAQLVCGGPVLYRMSLSPSGRMFVRCDTHWAVRLKEQERINRDYPDSPIAPGWFDPANAGERWDEE